MNLNISVPGKGVTRKGVKVSEEIFARQFNEALGANRSSMQKMLQALSDLGVEERDMATGKFPIH